MPRQLAFGSDIERIEQNIEQIISRLEKLERQASTSTGGDERQASTSTGKDEHQASTSAGEDGRQTSISTEEASFRGFTSPGIVQPRASTSTGEAERTVTRQPFRQGNSVSLQPRYTIYSIGPRRSGSLFDQGQESRSQPTVPTFGKRDETSAKIQIRRVRFADQAISSGIHLEEENIIPIWLFKEEQVQELEAKVPYQDQPVVNMFVNNIKTMPDYTKYPKLKVAVSSFKSDRLKDKPFKLLANKEMTGAELHGLVRKAHGIPEHESLTLVYPQYRVIEPDSTNLWQYGVRYFPAYIAHVPEDFHQGDLMEVTFSKRGPNVNGSGKTLPHSQ